MRDKAIIFDIDGTAIDSPEQKLPNELLVKVIKKIQNRYYLCAATGRVWSFARPVLQALNLSDPCIISAGTQICNPKTGEILLQKNVDNDALQQALEILKNYPDYKLLYNDGTQNDYLYGGISPKDIIINEPVYFLEQIFVPDEIAPEIHQKLLAIPDITCVMAVAQRPKTRDLHIINKSATKEHAVAELLKIINVEKENTIGIGDGHNDIHLFNAVHHKVAVGNAVSELKEISDQVIESVKEEGMAHYLQSLLSDF